MGRILRYDSSIMVIDPCIVTMADRIVYDSSTFLPHYENGNGDSDTFGITTYQNYNLVNGWRAFKREDATIPVKWEDNRSGFSTGHVTINWGRPYDIQYFRFASNWRFTLTQEVVYRIGRINELSQVDGYLWAVGITGTGYVDVDYKKWYPDTGTPVLGVPTSEVNWKDCYGLRFEGIRTSTRRTFYYCEIGIGY